MDYLKGPKKKKRVTKDGFEYNYAEGRMIYPDDIEQHTTDSDPFMVY